MYQYMNSYHLTRSTLLKSIIRYPHIEDYQYSLKELDIDFMFILCCNVNQLYGSYTELHDIVVKNLDKLMQPRDDELK